MAPPTARQRMLRARIESLIRLAEPGLNLLLFVGERIAHAVEREDPDYVPARPLDESSPLRRRPVRLNTPPGEAEGASRP